MDLRSLRSQIWPVTCYGPKVGFILFDGHLWSKTGAGGSKWSRSVSRPWICCVMCIFTVITLSMLGWWTRVQFDPKRSLFRFGHDPDSEPKIMFWAVQNVNGFRLHLAELHNLSRSKLVYPVYPVDEPIILIQIQTLENLAASVWIFMKAQLPRDPDPGFWILDSQIVDSMGYKFWARCGSILSQVNAWNLDLSEYN